MSEDVTLTNRGRFLAYRHDPTVNVCEWDPVHGRPARLDDDWHADAAVVVGAYPGRDHRVCFAYTELPRFAGMKASYFEPPVTVLGRLR